MRRLNLSVTEGTMRRIDGIIEDGDGDYKSKAEVIKYAVRVLGKVLSERRNGNSLCFKNEDGEITEVWIT